MASRANARRLCGIRPAPAPLSRPFDRNLPATPEPAALISSAINRRIAVAQALYACGAIACAAPLRA
jgi:hypothetical protein